VSASLTSFSADTTPGNPDRVLELVNLAGRLHDDAPVVLLPVRLETRFVTVDVPIDGPGPTLLDLRDLLQKAAKALAEIAAADLRTSLQDRGDRTREEFRDKAEQPLYALLANRLGEAANALEQARVLERDVLVAGDGGEEAVGRAAAGVRSGLEGAGRAIAQLRSEFQRTRFQEELDGLRAMASNVLGMLELRTLPAVALRTALAAPSVDEELARRDAARRIGLARGAVPVPEAPRVVRATAAAAGAVAPTAVAIPGRQLAIGAAVYQAVLRGIERAADDPEAIARLAGSASTIPLLPGAYKRDLLAAAEKLGSRTHMSVDDLLAAIRRIRSDDPRLDETVPRGDITIALPPATRSQDRLLVRMYPDDLAVDTHEEDLTAAERNAGIAFWTETLGADEAGRRAAWRALCLGRGSRRAAWIAEAMPPHDPAPTPGALAAPAVLDAMEKFEKGLRAVDDVRRGGKLPALADAAEALEAALAASDSYPAATLKTLRDRWVVARSAAEKLLDRRPPATVTGEAAEALERVRRALALIERRLEALAEEPLPQPVFPDAPAEPKAAGWTRAPGSSVLPERFLVVAVAGDKVVHAVAGGPVDPQLKLGIDPDPAAGEQFSFDDHGELTVAASIRWMVDFAEAESKGMALAIDVTPEEAQAGFDRVYAIGLRGDGPEGGATRLEAMLDAHHFGGSGLSLIAPGTPTNNTEAASAGMDSTDDPDASYARERGASAFDPTADLDAHSADGLRLARALGVDGARLAHVEGADGRSVANALTMGRVLHAATIGGWLEEMAAPLVPLPVRDRLRALALEHVAARGLVPAFRTGSQPYGVLPVTAWGAFTPDSDEAPSADPAAQAMFDALLKRLLDAMLEDWRAARAVNVRIATDPPDEDARAHFLRVLGLEPVAVTGGYRFAVNVAGRHGPPSLETDLRFGLPPKSEGAVQTGAGFGPFALLERFDQILRDAYGIASTAPLRDPETGLVHQDLAELYGRVQNSRAYELRLLRRAHQVRGAFAGTDPGAALTALMDADPSTLVADALAGHPSPSVLALLVRHAHLMELRDAAMRLLVGEGALSLDDRVAIGSSGQFLTGVSAEALTAWTYLLRDLAQLNGIQRTFPGGHPLLVGGRLIDKLKPSATSPAEPYAAPVAAHAADVRALATLPADELARLLGEALDLAGPRLDAWITGFAERRLVALRAATPRGAHVGAYGWVDDLRPDAGHPLAPNVPAELDGDPSRPVHLDLQSQGFVHAPSVNHAVTAAILRSGYLSQHRQADVENRMAVNLSSRRTRLALGLIDGVRAGNRLGALLGYRLERFLHEFYTGGGPTLDAVIAPIRQAYPSIAGVDRALSDDVAARQVCDGLAILETVQGWIDDEAPPGPVGRTVAEVLSANLSARPWRLAEAAVPAAGDPKLDGFIKAIDHIADALDAVADLVVAEGVHQLALGNHVRAAAVLTALAEGKAPPRPEIVDTPRSGTPLSHKVLLPLPLPPGGAPLWSGIPLTPRAAAEPALNAWLAGLLGDPDDLRVKIVVTVGGADAGDVSVTDLGLHAIDLVAILGPGVETGWGELAARALDHRRPADVDDAAPPLALQVDVGRRSAWGPEVRSVFELAPLLEALGTLIGHSRPATSHDYAPAVPGAAGGADGVDAGELAGRLAAAQAALTAAGVALARVIAADPSLDEAVLDGDAAKFLKAHATAELPPWAEREQWRSALLAAAAFGITAATPPAYYPSRVPVRRELRSAAETAFAEVVDRRKRAAEALARGAAAGAAAAQFGEAFRIVPRLAIDNLADVQAALAASPASPAELEGWLQGAASVRAGAAALADAFALADAADAPLPQLAVAQLPHDPAEPWLGGGVPPSDVAGAGRLSLVVAGLLEEAALLVDEWPEAIPATHETTGVAVHYDQPDASPPQAVLVAVPPVVRGRWRLGELLQTLHDTFELAQVRAVELEHLADTIYGQLLPAISGELVPEAVGGAAAPGDRVVLDFGVVG
jgi:hypothetical protein